MLLYDNASVFYVWQKYPQNFACWYMGFTMQLFANIGGGKAKSRQGLSLYAIIERPPSSPY